MRDCAPVHRARERKVRRDDQVGQSRLLLERPGAHDSRRGRARAVRFLARKTPAHDRAAAQAGRQVRNGDPRDPRGHARQPRESCAALPRRPRRSTRRSAIRPRPSRPVKEASTMQAAYKNCQSCGMPLNRDEHHGSTEADGSRSRSIAAIATTKGVSCCPTSPSSRCSSALGTSSGSFTSPASSPASSRAESRNSSAGARGRRENSQNSGTRP